MRFVPVDPDEPQHQAFGVMFVVTPRDAAYPIECERAPDNGSSAPDSAAAESLGYRIYHQSGDVLVDPLVHDDAIWWYRFRALVPNIENGDWGLWYGVQADLLPDEYPVANSSVYPLLRSQAMVEGGHAALADDPAGELLAEAVTQNDGISSRSIAKGYQRGTGQNGDAISFAVPFQNPPMIILRGGASYEPRAKWGATGDGSESGAVDAAKPQYDDLVALNMTASGFDLRARLRQKGAQTAQKDDFASGDLVALSDTVEATIVPAAAASDTYTVRFNVMLRVICALHQNSTGQITVAIDSNDGGGWVERVARVYSGTAIAGVCTGAYEEFTWPDEILNVVVSGLGSSDKFRLRLKVESGLIDSYLVHGWIEGTDGVAGVTYFSATDVYASKTPDADDQVDWEAIAVS